MSGFTCPNCEWRSRALELSKLLNAMNLLSCKTKSGCGTLTSKSVVHCCNEKYTSKFRGNKPLGMNSRLESSEQKEIVLLALEYVWIGITPI